MEYAGASLGVRADLNVEPLYDSPGSILGDPIRPEDALVTRMQCMACVEICPVGIEHVPIINQMRRGLVERGEMDNQLQSTLETIYTSGNSFGEAKRKRARWAKALDFELKDARKEPVEYLWFVGDYASFDPRNQRITQALARILDHAGSMSGSCMTPRRPPATTCAAPARKASFTSLAEENIQAIEKCDFRTILTSDPHSFNTLRNEYPELGASWDKDDVLHHSRAAARLLEEGSITPRKRLDYRVTYHDPCHLGRDNKVYEPPRDVMKALGIELVEMPRNRDNSFCRGARGGRIWMKELKKENAQRPSENRIDEAVALGRIQYYPVACPKDVTMYEDAIKTSGHADDIELREISELVLEALDLEPAGAVAGGDDDADPASE